MCDKLLHPVGSLYWSKEATDPAELFGGTWEQINLVNGAEMLPKHSFASLPCDTDKMVTLSVGQYDHCWRRTA